jgi:hypothetical protein
LGAAVAKTYRQVTSLLQEGEFCGLSIPYLRDIAEALGHTQVLLEYTRPAVTNRHLELSQFAGDVWRRNFVTRLFVGWWNLTGRDPVPSAGPFQVFVEAAWCSLSPEATAVDADWRSAIQTCLDRSEPGSWRLDLWPITRVTEVPKAVSDSRLDDFVKLLDLREQVRELERKLKIK